MNRYKYWATLNVCCDETLWSSSHQKQCIFYRTNHSSAIARLPARPQSENVRDVLVGSALFFPFSPDPNYPLLNTVGALGTQKACSVSVQSYSSTTSMYVVPVEKMNRLEISPYSPPYHHLIQQSSFADDAIPIPPRFTQPANKK
jgi:hypothetical protein